MRDSNVANAAKESAQAEFPHGLLDFCPYRSLVAHRRAKRDDRAGVEKAKFGVSTYSAYAIYAINSSPQHRRILDIL
jgi:hypothetical protein